MRHHHHYDSHRIHDEDIYSEDSFDIDDAVEELEKLQSELKSKAKHKRPHGEARRAIDDYLEQKRRKLEEDDPLEKGEYPYDD